ncbi:MAG: archaeoflavoprotein AfpA [Candidatus Lokiarchaeota archaeon]|nr:archaeoflavoprotein AfpA [Candidatus Lokiarchaeota archaeon]
MSKTKLRIAWGITGAGDMLPELMEIMKDLAQNENLKIRIFLSKAGRTVIDMYKFWDDLEAIGKVKVEKDANTPFLAASLQLRKYDFFLIAPSTANTTAKIVHGIADTLITNSLSQGIKGGCPIYILPSDQEFGTTVTILPSGKELKLTMRPMDVNNVEKLRQMQGITVLKKPEDIRDIINKNVTLD